MSNTDESTQNPLEKMEQQSDDEGILGNSVQCSMCDRTYSNKSNVKKHEEIDHKGLRFLCMYCEVFTTTKKSLQNHIAKYHSNEPQNIQIIGDFFWMNSDGSVLSRDEKLAKILQLEEQIADKTKIASELKAEIHSIETKIQELSYAKNERIDDIDGKIENNDESCQVGQESIGVIEAAEANPIADVKWTREEDRILLERIKEDNLNDIYIENRTKENINNRVVFLIDFLKSYTKK